MRTTVDIPDTLMKKAKIKAVEEGISLKQLLIRSLKKELGSSEYSSNAPWKELQGSGTAGDLSAEDSGFEGYSGPDWNHALQTNEPD